MKERKSDREILLEIFKRAGVEVSSEKARYFEVEPATYGENIGFEFNKEGKLKRII